MINWAKRKTLPLQNYFIKNPFVTLVNILAHGRTGKTWRAKNRPRTNSTGNTLCTFGDDFKVSLAVALNSGLLDARPRHRHFLRVSRFADRHQVRTLGVVLLGELEGNLKLTFNARHVDARVRRQTVLVGDHVALQSTHTKLIPFFPGDMAKTAYVMYKTAHKKVQNGPKQK